MQLNNAVACEHTAQDAMCKSAKKLRLALTKTSQLALIVLGVIQLLEPRLSDHNWRLKTNQRTLQRDMEARSQSTEERRRPLPPERSEGNPRFQGTRPQNRNLELPNHIEGILGTRGMPKAVGEGTRGRGHRPQCLLVKIGRSVES